MKKVKIIANDNFQKSIESTVKVLADDKNLNIRFGDSNDKNKTVYAPKLFKFSILYLYLLFLILVIDKYV